MSTDNDNDSQNPGSDHPQQFLAPDRPEDPQIWLNQSFQDLIFAWLRELWRLFIGRSDTYGVRRLGNDRVTRLDQAITDRFLISHVVGECAIHVYPRNIVERGVKICVLDVDCHSDVPADQAPDVARRNFTYIQAVWRHLRDRGLPAWLEDSNGRGGYHLWLFVDNLSNSEAISVTHWMSQLVEANDVIVERYPGGSRNGNPEFGTCIRLPGRHHTRPHYSRFLIDDNWIEIEAVVSLLAQVQPVAASGLPEEALIFRPPNSVERALPTTAQQHERADRAAPPLHVMRAALQHLGADYYDAKREEWLLVGMGLHACVRTDADSQLFFDLWAGWSAQARGRWNLDAAVHDWNSFEQRERLFQWQDLMRLAMAEGYEPPTCWHPDYSQQLQVDTSSAVPYVPAPPTGEAVSIEDLRRAVLQSRIDSVSSADVAGVFLDRSGTGSGKSTADLEIAKRGHKVLVVVPDHTNVREIAAEAMSRGLRIVAFPKRVYGGLDADESNPPNPEVNCWNPDADVAQSAGLAIQHSVCRDCQHIFRCRHQSGYLKQVADAKRTNERTPGVIIVSHRRAQLTGLTKICGMYGIQYVAVHESLLEFVAPTFSMDAANVRELRNLLQNLRESPDFVERFGISSEPTTTDRSSFAWNAYYRQQELEAGLSRQERRRRQGLRIWVSTAIEILTRLESVLTDGSATATEVNLTELHFRRFKYPIQDLHGLLWRARQHADEENSRNLGSVPGHASGNSRREAGPSNVIRFLMELTARTVRRLVKWPAKAEAPARLIAVARVILPGRIPVWFSDATAELENLRAVVPEVSDMTPPMHVAPQHQLLQLPDFDITRTQRTGPNSTVGKALRRLQPIMRGKRSICVFCHLSQLDLIRQTLPANVTVLHHFHAGAARGSNSIYREHDMVLVLGTPRAAGPATVVDRMVQLGEIDALNEPGEWGSRTIQIFDVQGRTRVIAVRGYGQAVWNRAYNSIVAPELRQTIGRARHGLSDGCDVIVVSAHLIASEFLPFRAISLTAAQDNIWQACRQLGETFAPRDIRELTGIKSRTISQAIARLVELGYLSKVDGTAGRSTRYQLAGQRQEGRESADDGWVEEEDEYQDEYETDEI